MQQIFLAGITPSDFFSRLEEMIENRLRQHNPQQPQVHGYLSRQEVSKLLRISYPTLNEWSKQGILKSYKIGTRVLYREDEIQAAIEKLPSVKFKKQRS
jgi:excisionase family DNA binding protein